MNLTLAVGVSTFLLLTAFLGADLVRNGTDGAIGDLLAAWRQVRDARRQITRG